MKSNMNKQEENWELMTKIGIPWHNCAQITDQEDRKILLSKVVEIEAQMKEQQQQQQQQQQGGGGPMQYS